MIPRKYPRIQVSFPVTLDYSSGRREAHISDISLGGCFVDTILDVIEGEAISLMLKIASDEWLILRGAVVYLLVGKGFGVQFFDLSESEMSRLENVILTGEGGAGKSGHAHG